MDAAATAYRALTHPSLCGPLLQGESWRPWLAVLAATFGVVPDTQADRDLILRVTGRTKCPTTAALALWVVAGRRAGKTWMMAILTAIKACLFNQPLAPGERGVVVAVSADRKQAAVFMGYVSAILQQVPAFRSMVVNETRDAIELSNGITIEIATASYRSIRGRTVVLAVCDELAFWRRDDAADPDFEILNAIRPSMATVPDALLVCISSPYARSGELYKAYAAHFGQDDDRELVVQADTRTLNATVPQSVIDRAYADDPASAAAEYGAVFRRDVETFISREAVEACVVPGRLELPPSAGVSYVGFLDPAGGSGQDSFTMCIAHRSGDRVVVDVLRERRPPFSPDDVTAQYAQTLQAYGVSTVYADRFGGEWPAAAFRQWGIGFRTARKSKSALYRDLLAPLNAGRVELLDSPRLKTQLLGLERRTARGGRDSIDHAPRAHDDCINAAAGAIDEVTTSSQRGPMVVSIMAREHRASGSLALQAVRRRKTAALLAQLAADGE